MTDLPEAQQPYCEAYIGDGLYASCTRQQITLFAHDGLRKLNEVFLDADVLERFLAYVEDLQKENRI